MAPSSRLATVACHLAGRPTLACGVAASEHPPLELVTGTPLAVSDLMLGCAFVNSRRDEAAADDARATATVAAAIAAGIRDFDTAPFYGASEDRVGKALAAAAGSGGFSAGGKGKDLRVWTKIGVVRDGGTVAELGATAQGAQTSFTESTQRLGVKSLSGLRFHDIPDAKGGGTLPTIDDLIAAAAAPGSGMVAGIVALKAAGLVDEISIGMNASGGRRSDWSDPDAAVYGTPEQIVDLIRAVPDGTFDSLLMASGWNLLYHEGAVVLRECAAKGIAVHNA
jgi:D-threo-aldose 1-dehydrogenase